LDTQNPSKKRQLGDKTALFGPKTGQNQGFAVTYWLTWQKCMLLNTRKLQGIKWSKKDFHRVGGWGVGWILGEEKEKMDQDCTR
jgi:hypothetical protein